MTSLPCQDKFQPHIGNLYLFDFRHHSLTVLLKEDCSAKKCTSNLRAFYDIFFRSPFPHSPEQSSQIHIYFKACIILSTDRGLHNCISLFAVANYKRSEKMQSLEGGAGRQKHQQYRAACALLAGYTFQLDATQ